jgi:esterase/lipase superfamily enzyme
MVRFAMLPFLVMLCGCISGISYGDIAHHRLAEGPACIPANDSYHDEAFFWVSSRLPNCQGVRPELTAFRGLAMSMGYFTEPERAAKGGVDPKGAFRVDVAAQESWWGNLERQAASKGGKIFIYVHGYRETFRGSAADTAQIARLSAYDGPIILYSWPSQGELLSYGVDETNMYWDERNFRNFLIMLAEKPWVKDITVVSHSLGARLVIPAIEYVDQSTARQDAANISTIVLVSPDVDRREFERDAGTGILHPRLVSAGRRVTIYVSNKDQALGISRTLHGYPRLGRPFCFDPFEAQQLVAAGHPERCYPASFRDQQSGELTGLTVVDTTDVSGSGSGHSDYLRSAQACSDFAAVLQNGGLDQGDSRQKTHLPYVFRLARKADKEKPDNDALCKRRP